MNRSFVFEIDNPAEKAKTKKEASQSPWDFSGYADAVETEHQKRQTSSVDHKISKLKVQKGLSKKKSKKRRHEESEENEEPLADSTNKKRKKRKAPDSENADSDPEENGSSQVSGEFEGEHGIESQSEEYVDDTAEVPKEPEKLGKKRKNKKAKGAAEDTKKDVRKMKSFFSSCEGASFISKSFVDLNISRPLIRACEALGYKDPTPIQTACIPLALTGRDICGSAVTGSGKTAAFALPLLERLLFRPRRIPAIRVLILTPTRELAVQLHSMIEKLAQYTDVRCCAIVGGLSSKLQETALRTHPDIVIATPGRMLDHLQNSQSVGLEELAILVLDEADRLLELGFQEEVHELVRLCPKKRQTMLFSATMTEEVDELIKLSLNSPVRLSADPLTKRPATLLEEVIKMKPSHEPDREAILLSLCSRSFSSKVIIFSGTKVEAHRLKIIFGLSGLKAAELHGNLTQVQRLSALESFRKQEVDFLIATDVAARGLDIIGVESVINFQCPPDITMYVHRVGRTARAGRQGCAVTFMSGKDRPLLKAMVKRIGGKLQNRIVSPDSIANWRTKLEGMEEDIAAIISEEREERALRKAEMEMNKAQNMMEHEAEIYSRPRKTWFQSSKEKKLTANQSKEPRDGPEKGAPKKKITSVLEAKKSAKDLKAQLEREQRLPRKKRRRLQAAREAAVEDEEEDNDASAEDGTIKVRAGSTHSKKSVKDGGKTLVEVGYRRAKAAKAEMKAREAGKVARGSEQLRKKSKAPNRKAADFDGAMPEATSSKSSRFGKMAGFKKKKKLRVSKKAFKSKSRYKRRK